MKIHPYPFKYSFIFNHQSILSLSLLPHTFTMLSIHILKWVPLFDLFSKVDRNSCFWFLDWLFPCSSWCTLHSVTTLWSLFLYLPRVPHYLVGNQPTYISQSDTAYWDLEIIPIFVWCILFQNIIFVITRFAFHLIPDITLLIIYLFAFSVSSIFSNLIFIIYG